MVRVVTAYAATFLAANGFVINFKWNRRRPCILTALQRFAGTGHSLSCNAIGICAFSQPGAL